jgi:hypothetical protein
MSPPLIVIDTPPWWRRPWGLALIGSGVAAVAACVMGSASPVVPELPAPARPAPSAVATTPRASFSLMAVPVEATHADEAPASAPAPSTPSTPALSTEVAPGVHVTPISRPPAGLAVPPAPRVEDSEPEN